MTQSKGTLWKEWKEKSRVDYTPIFVALWLSFNAWVKGEYFPKDAGDLKDEPNTKDESVVKNRTDRYYINSLKEDESSTLSNAFGKLINPQKSNELSLKFCGDFAGLIRSLRDANIPYDTDPEKIISFESYIVKWDKTPKAKQKYVSVTKQRGQKNKIKIDDGLWVDNNVQFVFAAYVEILYQIRCAFFHGTLSPIKENDRVIRHLYLTLSVLMEKVQ